jgi:predicted DNA-binding transcriptional regulator YafY
VDANANLEDFASRSFCLFQGAALEVVWRFVPEAADGAAEFGFHPWQKSDRQPDLFLVVRFSAAGDLEMAWHLCAWDDKVEVLTPPALAAMVATHRVSWPALP